MINTCVKSRQLHLVPCGQIREVSIRHTVAAAGIDAASGQIRRNKFRFLFRCEITQRLFRYFHCEIVSLRLRGDPNETQLGNWTQGERFSFQPPIRDVMSWVMLNYRRQQRVNVQQIFHGISASADCSSCSVGLRPPTITA